MPKINREREAKRQRQAKLLAALQEMGVTDVEGVQELYKEMVGTVLSAGLEGELDEELGYSKYDYRNKETENSRNGHYSKTMKSSFGEMEVSVPRDRKGEFEPELIKKHQTALSREIEEKIISMYAKGMTTGDIESHIQEIYGLSVSDSTISRVTDKILPIVKDWVLRRDTATDTSPVGRRSPLEELYAVVLHGRHPLPRP